MHECRKCVKRLYPELCLLPAANEVWGKVMFLHLSVCPQGGGVVLCCHFLLRAAPPPPRTAPPSGQQAVGNLLEFFLVLRNVSICSRERKTLLLHYQNYLSNFKTIYLNGALSRNLDSSMLYYRPQRSWGKVMFLHVCVILFTGGGVLPQCMLGYHPPGTRHHPPPSRPPPGSVPSPQSRTYWKIRSMSGRYASYWNVILLYTRLQHNEE